MTNKAGKTGNEAGSPDSHTPIPPHAPTPSDAADPSINSHLREDATAGMAGQALRRIAEERLREKQTRQKSEVSGQQATEDAARLVHELQVHQIELEMQNEELQQARATADALLAQYTDLYDFAPTGYLTLDRQGAIRQLNLTGRSCSASNGPSW